MADQLHRHHHQHQHRPDRLSVPPRATTPTTPSGTISRSPPFPCYPSTPTPTPSKHRLSSFSSLSYKSASRTTSFSFLFILLLSLRSLYSLLPFLRSSPSSFSIFPFAFLVSLLSFLLTLSFSLFTTSSSSSNVPFQQKQQHPIFFFTLLTQSQHKLLVAKSLLLVIVFLLRFQALRYCGTAAMILAELCGNAAARFVIGNRNTNLMRRDRIASSEVRGFLALFIGLLQLSISWDRIQCFPLSSMNRKFDFSMLPTESCVRIWPMLLPFLSGFLGCYERLSMNWGTIRELGRNRIRLISLFFTTVLLFIPAVVSMFVFEAEGDSVSLGNLGWPLANTVIFGVLLSENYSDEKLTSSKDSQGEFFVTFVCTLVLELFYFPELSLWGLLICGLLLWYGVRELDSIHSNYLELGLESTESFTASIVKPIRHILSERKSRKIALFLLINAAYMVVEFAVGFMSNSLGLISDACHMLFDCAALAIGLYASYISRLPANSQFNYGRGRFEVLSGYVNAVFLVLVGALIVLESFERILDPQEISTSSLLTVSIGGLLVNVVGLIFFHEEHHHAHGGSGACLHSHSQTHSDSHSHSHSHGQHHHCDHGPTGHDHRDHGKHQESITVFNDCHQKSCSGHVHNVCDKSHGSDNTENHKSKVTRCNNHDHHGHRHQHDHHGHDRHDLVHRHDHKNHDHYDQGHQHDHHNHDYRDHGHQHHHHHHHYHPAGHHDHVNQHDHHNHDHHDHGHQHDPDNHDHHDHGYQDHHHRHHYHYADHHVQGSFPDSSSRSLLGHSLEGHAGEASIVLGGSHCEDHRKLLSDGEEPQKHHHHIDHNMEGIFLHVLADTMGSVGVVISTLLIKYKGWLVADPACSIFISVLIISSVIPLLRNSAEILLQRVPRAHEQDLKEALKNVMKIKGVCSIRNLHIWSFTNTDVVGTLHLHVLKEMDKASAKAQVSHLLHGAGIKDLTIQVMNV